VNALENALSASTTPFEVMHAILNLAEHMERRGDPLPIPRTSLISFSLACHSNAKAMHWEELQFIEDSRLAVLDSLIDVNHRIQDSEVAIGIAKCYGAWLHDEWYERLERWEIALEAYEQRDPDDLEASFGRMRCLHALGHWQPLVEVANQVWEDNEHDIRIQQRVAPLGAAAAW
jgi:FKBP12-rapamycin complex-associated protein